MSEQQNGGVLTATLGGLQMGGANAHEGFVWPARDFLAGFEAIPKGLNGAIDNAAMSMAAQSLECMLKAYLSHNNRVALETLKKRYSHDLVKCWNKAVSLGLDIAVQPPGWVRMLQAGHDPFYFRYRQNLNGMNLHLSPDMLPGLQHVHDTVMRALQGSEL